MILEDVSLKARGGAPGDQVTIEQVWNLALSIDTEEDSDSDVDADPNFDDQDELER
jgi:hypothetical protein